MNTLSPPEIDGLFWLSENEETKVSGRCRCTEDGSIELEILGTLSGKLYEHYDQKIPRILGVSSKGKLLTLDNCFYQNWNFNSPGLSVGKIYVHRMFVGAHFSDGDDISVDSISFQSDALDEWIRYTPINVECDYGENSRVTLDYAPPTSPKWNLNDGCISFKFVWNSPDSEQYREAKITQKTLIDLTFPCLKSVDEATSFIMRFSALASFACDQTLPIHSITGYRNDLFEEYGNQKVRKPIKIYMNLVRSHECDYSRLVRPFVLFDFKLISENLEERVQIWLDSYSKFESAFNLYFATKSRRQLFLENKYLMLAQAVETLHRKMSSEVAYDEDEYAELSSAVMDGVPLKFHDWIEARLRYGNELSLRKRLKRLFSGYEEIFGGSDKVKSLIASVVNTRNYLTHYDESLKEKAASGSEMSKLCVTLELILQVHFCRMVGFSNNEVHHIFSTSKAITDKKSEI